MKVLITLFLLSLSALSFAGKGVVIALNAPLLLEDDKGSLVLQTVRKGDVIYIHEGDFPPKLQNSYYGEEIDPLLKNWDRPKFFRTIAMDGTEVYIPSEYVKLVTNDHYELGKKVTLNPDTTDYRIKEPLPPNYPLIDNFKARSYIIGGFGPGRKNSYNTGSLTSKESDAFRAGTEIGYATKVDFDLYERLFFGGFFHVFSSQSESLTDDLRVIEESHTEIGAGPFLSYDFFNSLKHRLTLRGSLFTNFNRLLIKQTDVSNNSEQAFFQGFSFGGKLGTFWSYKSFIEGTKVDLVIGLEMLGDLPFSLTTDKEFDLPNYWNGNSLDFNSSLVYSAYIGIQGNY